MSGGTLAVAGEASFTGGTDVFYGGSTVDAGSLQVGSSSAAQTLTVNGAAFAVSGTASIAAGSTLSMYGGSFSTQGGITDSGTISGAGTIGGPISGTGTIYAEGGTLDLTGTVASGLTFQIYGDLKIDGTATMANSLGLTDPNQTLEIGPSGSLTITTVESDHEGTFKLDGGTLTNAQGFKQGSTITIAGFGTINGTEYGLIYQGPVVEADRRHTDAQRRHLCRQHHTRNSCRRDLLVTGRHREIPACWRTSWNRAVHLPLQRQRDA